MSDFTKSGQFIAQLRSERGMTQDDLGKLIGSSDKTVSKWERGQNVPDVLTIKKIADAFDVTITEIINGERNAQVSPRFIRMYENKKSRYAFFTVIGIFILFFLALLMYFCNNFDKFKIYQFKGEGKNYKLTGNIYQAGNEYKLVVDDFLVYDTSKYDELKIDSYMLTININGMVVYSFTKGKEIEQGNEKNEYIKYYQIINKINECDFTLQQFNNRESSNGYLELYFVEGGSNYTERFSFENILQKRNNAFYYDKGKDKSERTVKWNIDKNNEINIFIVFYWLDFSPRFTILYLNICV